MLDRERSAGTRVMGVLLVVVLCACGLSGCGPTYYELRRDGQEAMDAGRPGVARRHFEQADRTAPQRLENLYDLAICSMMVGEQKFAERNPAAAQRELDRAVSYFERALAVDPGHQPSLDGKKQALKLKGEFGAALRQAEWAATYVGPSAKQHIRLALELEERGDLDGAYLRLRQAVAMEPKNPSARIAFARFLQRRNSRTEAIEQLQAAYQLDPFNEEVASELKAAGALPVIESDSRG
jgi:tetratricopeptide (TPR) repeat protein